MSRVSLFWAAALLALSAGAAALPCSPLTFDEDSVVCVCNATYCDTFPELTPPSGADVLVVTSSRGGDRFAVTSAQFGPEACPPEWVTGVRVPQAETRQQVSGFGGAFTDAAGVNINSLSPEVQDQLLRAYFAEEGIRYKLGRVPIAGTDFSERPYSYDDNPGDESLEQFALTEEDFLLKIPHILAARELAPDLQLFGSAWSAPAWMKTNNDFIGIGFLKTEYYQLWADYIVRFLEEYVANGIPIQAITTQNEPTNVLNSYGFWNTMAWTPEMQRDWVRDNLGPTIRGNANFSDTKIIILDDQRILLPDWVNTILDDADAAQYVDAIGVHWYRDGDAPASLLTDTHKLHPNVPLIATEACEGSIFEKTVALGAWPRADTYAADILDDLNNWVTGWVDWNIALDMTGGPNWAGNYVDSPIIIDAHGDQFFKQPMYYALGHLSVLLPHGTDIVAMEDPSDSLKGVVGLRADGQTVVTLLNRAEEAQQVVVTDATRGSVSLTLPARSLTSVLYATAD
ncbi:Glucosylceramidase [Amphibalanus amphitrite]|uniref:Glucosylceramidase n=1 Tax=Amphibalanus amphitrite TaxID=1232801 RepID=A0A6A4X4F6_AMPAM|nr:Glucosylceramidase [Amphibalanus amphitrite]